MKYLKLFEDFTTVSPDYTGIKWVVDIDGHHRLLKSINTN